MATKVCVTCGKGYVTKGTVGKYCSRACMGEGLAARYARKREEILSRPTRTCKACGLTGGLHLFARASRRRRIGHENSCLRCKAEGIKAWRKKNPDKVEAYNRRALERVGGRRFWNYGITDVQFQALVESQGGACAICRRPSSEAKLGVDHDHDTGVVRGALCTNCNTAIGKMRESPAVLLAAIAYLKRHGKE